MNVTPSHTLSNRLALLFSAVVVFTSTASTASAQATPDLFIRVETLTLSDGTPAAGSFSIAGDTAVVAGDEVVHVFEREPGGDHWVHSATLVASDGMSDFGKTVATDGTTTVVGAGLFPDDGAAYVFQRSPGSQAWQETARLSGDVNASSFADSLAVCGTTVVVGAPGIAGVVPAAAGLVYVFEQDEEEPDGWDEVARLVGEPPAVGGQIDSFGISVDVESNTLVVAASGPHIPNISVGGGLIVHVFSRIHGGSAAWTHAARLVPDFSGLNLDTPGPRSVDISGDTIVAELVSSGTGNVAFVFQQHRGSDAWGQVARFGPRSGRGARISGDLVVVSASGPRIFQVFARNQGGADQWGEVPRGLNPPFLTGAQAISGDTILSGGGVTPAGQNPIEVYVADTDRDGLRDGIDACPRDPLNSVEGGCTRNSAAYLALDDLITLGDVATETRGDEFHITATFTNTSDRAIGNPFFEVTDLAGGNLLVNADAGPGGPGATLSPDVGDGILSPGEPTTVTFVVGLATREAFSFYVSVKGDAGP